MSNTVIYNQGELEINISLNNETIWLRQNEIASIFSIDRTGVTRHINKILSDQEVDEKSNVQKMHFANSDKPVKRYSLDIVLAVGYRTNSAKAIHFRQWATKVLKSYIQDGYVINTHKLTEQRLSSLENDMKDIKSQIKDNTLELKQGIFYDGEVFDAYAFVIDIFKSAKSKIKIIDNYIDDTLFTMLSKNKSVEITIYTQTISKQLKLDIEKYNKQYNNLEVKTTKNFHDRFIIIDEKEVYHIGASLKDLGKKVFAFSKLNIDTKNLFQNL